MSLSSAQVSMPWVVFLFRLIGFGLLSLGLLGGELGVRAFWVSALALGWLGLTFAWREQAAQRSVWLFVEGMSAAAVLVAGNAPLALAAVALLILSACHLALGGWWAFAMGLVGAIATLLALHGFELWSPAQAFDFVALGGLLLTLFSLSLAHVAYARVSTWRARSTESRARVKRMADYLPMPLRARLALSPLPPVALERRWLALVCVDLCDFTDFCEAAGPDVVARVVNEFIRALREQAQANSGCVVKLMGDGAILSFEATRQHPVTAVQHALGFCTHLSILAETLQRRCGVVFGLRAGVSCGTCTMGDWGVEGAREYAVIGSAVNRAARLQAAAAHGEALACEHIARLADPPLAEPTLIWLKGLGRVATYRVAPTADQPVVAPSRVC